MVGLAIPAGCEVLPFLPSSLPAWRAGEAPPPPEDTRGDLIPTLSPRNAREDEVYDELAVIGTAQARFKGHRVDRPAEEQGVLLRSRVSCQILIA